MGDKEIEQQARDEHRSWVGKVIQADALLCLRQNDNTPVKVYLSPPAIVTVLPTPDETLLAWVRDGEGTGQHHLAPVQDISLLVPYPQLNGLTPSRLEGRRRGHGVSEASIDYRLAPPDIQAQMAGSVAKLLRVHGRTEENPALEDQDGVQAVLSLSLKQLHELPEDGALDVDSVIEFFQVDTLEEITQAMLDDVRLTHGVAPAAPALAPRKPSAPAP